VGPLQIQGPQASTPSNTPTTLKVTRADVVREACSLVPLNHLNLPEGIHRSDLLHPYPPCVKKVIPQQDLERLPSGLDLSQGKYTDEGPLLILDEAIVRSSYIPLDYSEGFPTFPDTGAPFWGQLPFEPPTQFKTFEEYLKQGTSEGTRRLFALSMRPDIQQRAGFGTNRSSARPGAFSDSNQQGDNQQEDDATTYEAERQAAQQTNERLKEWHVIYYWQARARAYDLFYLDGIRQSQGMAALQLQNDHYRDAQALYHKVMEFINGENPEYQTPEGLSRFWAEMTPKVLIDFMKVLAQMSRVSLGLPGNAPAAMDSPTSAVGLLHSLVTGTPITYQGRGNRGGGQGIGSSRGPGRPRSAASLDDDTDAFHPSRTGQPGGSSLTGLKAPNILVGPPSGPPATHHGFRPANSSGHQPSGPPGSSQQPSAGHATSPAAGPHPPRPTMGDPADAERVRKIAQIFNSAKARHQASRTIDPTPTPTPTEEES
jgi:hypothetical protein